MASWLPNSVLIRLRDKTCAGRWNASLRRAFRCACHRRSARGATRSTGLPLFKPCFVTQPDKQAKFNPNAANRFARTFYTVSESVEQWPRFIRGKYGVHQNISTCKTFCLSVCAEALSFALDSFAIQANARGRPKLGIVWGFWINHRPILAGNCPSLLAGIQITPPDAWYFKKLILTLFP